MKHLIIFLGLAIATPLFAGGPYFDSGTYKGKGWCKNEGGEITLLNSELRVDGWKIAHLASDQKTKTMLDEAFFDTRDRGYGIFDLILDGNKVGWGYCASQPCHLQTVFKDQTMEWTIHSRHQGQNLDIMWSIQDSKRTLVCEEELTKQSEKKGK